MKRGMESFSMPRPVFRLVFSAAAHVGQKGNVPGTFDRAGQFALMFGASACLASWANFAFFGYITFEHIDGFVVNMQVFVRAKGADFWA